MKLTIEHLASYIPYSLKVQYEGIINGKELSDWDKKLKGYKSANTDDDFDLFFDDISEFIKEHGEKPNEIIGIKSGSIRQVHICKNHVKFLIGGRGMKVYYSNNIIFKPILTRVEDMSEEQIDKWIDIQEREENNLQFSIDASKFFYSNHIDIHNLIDCGLAIDSKTLKA